MLSKLQKSFFRSLPSIIGSSKQQTSRTWPARTFNSMSQQVSVNDEAMKGLKGGVIPEDTKNYWEVEDLTSIEFTLSDKPGILMKALDVFKKHNLNLTRI